LFPPVAGDLAKRVLLRDRTETPRVSRAHGRGLAINWRLAIVLVAVSLLVVWLCLLYSVSWHAFPGNSDDANAVLAGRSLVHGNPLLRGWELPGDPYWLTDLPVYGIVASVTGLRPSVMHLVPTILAGAVVLVGVALSARGLGRDGRRWIGRATTFVLIGLPVPLMTTFFLQGPQHVGTVLTCLIAFAILEAAPIFRRRWLCAVALLGAALIGDPMTLAIGIAPVAGGAIVAAARAHRWGRSLPGLAAAAFSTVGALAARVLLSALGGFTISRGPPLAPARAWSANAALVPHRALALLGILREVAIPGESTTSRQVHLAGTVICAFALIVSTGLVLAALVRSSWRAHQTEVRPPTRLTRWLDDVLTVGVWGSVAACVILSPPHGDFNADRYLVPAVIFSAILAGRTLTRVRWSRRPWSTPSITLSCLGLALGGSYLAASVAAVGVPTPRNPAAPLAHWLRARGLERGFGAYWDASIVTLEDPGRVRVRPVITSHGRLHALHFFAAENWFSGTERRTPARFIIYEPAAPFDKVNDATAIATFGRPASAAVVGPYRVLIWDRDLGPDLGLPTGLFQS